VRVLFGVLALYMWNVTVRALGVQLEAFGLGALASLVVALAVLLWIARNTGDELPGGSFYARCLAAYLAWLFISETVPISDFSLYAKQAVQLSTGTIAGLHNWKSPGTIAFFAGIALTLGQANFSLSLGAIIAWILSGKLLELALSELRLPPRAVSLSVRLFLLAPATLAYAPVVSSELPFILFLLASLLYAAVAARTGSLSRLALSSLFMGLVFLTRPNGLLFLPWLAGAAYALYRGAPSSKRMLRIAAASGIPITALILAFALLHLRVDGHWTPNPSPWGSLNLLFGTNRETNGGFNDGDYKLSGFADSLGPGTPEQQAAARRARELAFQRISADPAGFLGFALSRKISRLWGTETPSLQWTVGKSWKNDLLKQDIFKGLRRIADAYYLALLIAFAAFATCAAAGIAGIAYPSYWFSPLLLMCLLHVAIEVQPRYHIVLMPFIYVGAALLGVHAVPRRRGEHTRAA
jgi:hypothetical protein